MVRVLRGDHLQRVRSFVLKLLLLERHEVDLPVPVFQRQFGEEPAGGHAGIVDDHIDPAQLDLAGLGKGGELAVVAHIAALDKAIATRLAHQPESLLQAWLADIRQGQLPTLAGPAQRDFATQAGPGTGDHHAILHRKIALWFTEEVIGSVAKVFPTPTHHPIDECPEQTTGRVGYHGTP